jgi:dCMP deaminase
MTRPSRDEYYLKILDLVAARSTCARRAVGCIFTDAVGHVLSMGYNGVPVGWPHCTDRPCKGATDEPGQTDRCMAIHAEDNALLQCHRLDLLHTAYVSTTPCFQCAKRLCNTPLRRLVYVEDYADTRGGELLRYRKVELVKMEVTK